VKANDSAEKPADDAAPGLFFTEYWMNRGGLRKTPL